MTFVCIDDDNLGLLYGLELPISLARLRVLLRSDYVRVVAALTTTPLRVACRGGYVAVCGENTLSGVKELTLWGVWSDGTPGLALRLIRHAERMAREQGCRRFTYSKPMHDLGGGRGAQEIIIRDFPAPVEVST